MLKVMRPLCHAAHTGTREGHLQVHLMHCAVLRCIQCTFSPLAMQYSNYRGEAVNPRYLSLFERWRR